MPSLSCATLGAEPLPEQQQRLLVAQLKLWLLIGDVVSQLCATVQIVSASTDARNRTPDLT
jgi:hypothetical protein